MSGILDSAMDVSTQDISSDNVPEAETLPTFKKIGPTHRAKFIGVKYEQKKGQYSSFLRMMRNGKINQIGLFFSEEQAAISHDMQALKTYGLLAHDMLNFSYEYDEEYWNKTSQKSLKLRLSGATVIIECDGEEEQEPKGPSPETIIEMSTSNLVAVVPDVVNIEAEVVDSFLCSPPGTAAVLPGKSDVSRRWPERLISSFYPTAAFAYEVTFMHQSSLGLQLRPLMLTYSVAGGKRTLGCCVVIDSSQSPSPLVQAGDILVSVNGQSLIGPQPLAGSDQRESQREVSGGFSFDSSVKAISQASAPRTIRFLRTAGLSTNQQLSPAEASLLVSDHHPVAKYTVEQSVLPGGTPHQVMLYLDNQAPLTVRRMLQGQRIVWETNPQISQNTVPPVNSPYLHNVHQTESDTAGAGGGGGGVYKDRYRWLAVLYVPQGVSQGRHHMLGRFDSEDEAGAAYKWALEEVRITGAYSSRRKKRLSIMLDGSAVTLSGSASASQLASAATAAAFATAVASATAAASANAAASAVSATTAASATAASTTAATTTATAASATTTTNATANTAPSSLPLAPTPVAPSAQAQAPPLETKAS